MLRNVLTAALVMVSTAGFAAAQDVPPPLPGHAADLSGMSLETLADGQLVVTLVATGELAGLVTLRLQPVEGGTFNGEWTAMVTQTEVISPETAPEPEVPPADDPEAEPAAEVAPELVRFVVRGSLTGNVSGAQLTFDAEGALTDFSAPLTITEGGMEFAGISGAGSATAASLLLEF
jgi:hypothetical protein